MGRLLRHGLLVGCSRILSAWLLQGPLILYARSVGDQAPVGHLALALQALLLLCAIPWAIGNSALPVLSRGGGADSGYANGMMRLAFVFAAALGLAGMSVGPWLIARLFGAGYAQTGELLGPALWLLLPLTAATALNPLLLVRERYSVTILSPAVGAVTMTIAFPTLAAAMGPLGALVAAGLGLSIWALALLLFVVRQGGVSLTLAVSRPAVVVVLAVGVYAALTALGAGPWASLAGACITLAAAGLGLATAPAERQAMTAFARARWAARRGG
jgi:O-antigen/teichoic acid export membrane protein